MAYSIIPDILDKYLGLTYEPLNSGRTVAHSLLFIGIISFFLIAIVIYTHRHAILLVAAPLALLLHQLLDEIWKLPTTWFYPLLGPFAKDIGIGTPGPWFWGMVVREINDPIEWMSGIAIVLILGFMVYGQWVMKRMEVQG